MTALFVLSMSALLVVVYAGSSKVEAKQNKYTIKDFTGLWVLTDDQSYELKIYPDGSLESVDIGAGNPGIMGSMKILSAKKLVVNRTGDFDYSEPDELMPKLKYTFTSKGYLLVKYITSGRKMTFKRIKKSPGKNYFKKRLRKPTITSLSAGEQPGSVVIRAKEKDDGYYFGTGYYISYRPVGGKWTTKEVSYDDMKVKVNDIKMLNKVTYTLTDIVKQQEYEIKIRGYFQLGFNRYKTSWSKVERIIF